MNDKRKLYDCPACRIISSVACTDSDERRIACLERRFAFMEARDSHCLCRADIAQHEAINNRLKADLTAAVEQIERLRCGVDLYKDGCIRLRSEITKLEDENMKVHHSMNAKHASLMAVVEWAKENVPDACSCSPEYTDRNLRDRSCQYCLLNSEELWEIIMGVE